MVTARSISGRRASSDSGFASLATCSVRRAKQIVALRRHMRNGDGFVIPEADQAAPANGFPLRGAASAPLATRAAGKRGGKLIKSVDPRDFFHQIDLAFHVGAPGRLRALPSRQQRIRRATVVVHAHGGKTKRAEMASMFLSETSAPRIAQEFRAGDAVIFLPRAFPDTRPRHRQAVRLRQAAKSIPRSGAKLLPPFPDRRRGQSACSLRCGASGNVRPAECETGSNQAHSISTFFVEKEISVCAPPMIATANGPRSIAIAYQEHVGSNVRSMPSRVFIFSLGLAAADHNFMVAHLVVVERMNWIAEFEHHVIGDVHDVADAGYAGSFEAFFQPRRREARILTLRITLAV